MFPALPALRSVDAAPVPAADAGAAAALRAEMLQLRSELALERAARAAADAGTSPSMLGR
jgi:hypothetical protein